jgi:hypothetical protein
MSVCTRPEMFRIKPERIVAFGLDSDNVFSMNARSV